MSAAPVQRFKIRLKGRGPGRAWTFIDFPFRVEKVWGTRARVPISGTINGTPFRSSAMPRGDGVHAMMVCKELKDEAGVKTGDTVSVVARVDSAKRAIKTPPALNAALKRDKVARERYGAKSYSWKKEHALYLLNAKRPETRAKRLGQVLALLRA